MPLFTQEPAKARHGFAHKFSHDSYWQQTGLEVGRKEPHHARRGLLVCGEAAAGATCGTRNKAAQAKLEQLRKGKADTDTIMHTGVPALRAGRRVRAVGQCRTRAGGHRQNRRHADDEHASGGRRDRLLHEHPGEAAAHPLHPLVVRTNRTYVAC